MALYVNGNKIGGGGGNSNMQELTQEEYDELTTEEKNNGTVYYITDANGDGESFQPIIYSETEREIGVWTDGKPLYQKTIKITQQLTVGQDNFINHGISNIDKCISIKGFCTYNQQDEILPMPYVSKNPTSFSIVLGNVTDTTFLIALGDTFSSVENAIITFQYTKTTDTDGSGTWTPQGVPAVHYSTDEQVIGTWIDGSTLYEKTFSFTPTDNNFYIDVTSLNIDKIINSNGSIFQLFGNVVPLPYCTNTSDFAIAYYDSNNEKLKISEASGQYNYNLNVQWVVTWQYTKSSQGGS